MNRLLICCACQWEFFEQEVSIDETFEELQDGELVLVEVFCPNCGSDELEDMQNLIAVRELKGHV